MIKVLLLVLTPYVLFANPYFDPAKVPQDQRTMLFLKSSIAENLGVEVWDDAEKVLRVQVKWQESTDSFVFDFAVIESSGSETLLTRAKNQDVLGSYQGTLVDPDNQQTLYYSSIGTGSLFRKLTRALTFIFPLPAKKINFVLHGEHPITGTQEKILETTIDPDTLVEIKPPVEELKAGDLEVRLLQPAKVSPKLLINIYAEGYLEVNREKFWQHAQKVVNAFNTKNFPLIDHFEIKAVFYPSNKALGSAQDLGLPVPERDSYLGFYYPYWENFGRWYHIVYPTREQRYRVGIGKVPYDYPIVLVDSNEYWGVGNYNELTAIPALNSSFTYLLMHEFGHYLGLNEEYDGGGRTELEFAEEIDEPWSQNLTFLPPGLTIKWQGFIKPNTPLPTPHSYWYSTGEYGAYLGGYADSEPQNKSYKPGLSCTMERAPDFCSVCKNAIAEKIKFDLGI